MKPSGVTGVILLGLLSASSLIGAALEAKEPIFVLYKIDGPVHDPENGSFWYGPFSEGTAVFDVNGDGRLDITSGDNWYEGPHWKKHQGFRPAASTHGEFVNNCGEFSVDVNGDGRLDIISAGWMKNGVWSYENPGPGKVDTVWKATKIGSTDYIEGLVVEDIDADGDTDVLIDHGKPDDAQGVTWLEFHGAGRFETHVLGTDGDYHGIGLGDLNGDGRKDIITPHGWYMAPEDRRADWIFYKDYRIDKLAGVPIVVVDVNRDGRNDIIYGHGHDYGLGWIEQVGPTTGGAQRNLAFRQHVIEDSFSQFHTMALADVDQDGRLDLVTGKRLRGHAGRDPGSSDPLGLFWYEIDGGRFKKNVLAYNHVLWYPNGDTAKNPAPTVAVGTGTNINVVDIDHDGRVDIVVGGKSGLYVFHNRGLPPTKKIE